MLSLREGGWTAVCFLPKTVGQGMGCLSVLAAEYKGSLLLNRDGLANAGFVWEEVCVSEELDALVNKRKLAWGHLRSIFKPVLASLQRTEARGGS